MVMSTVENGNTIRPTAMANMNMLTELCMSVNGTKTSNTDRVWRHGPMVPDMKENI